MVTLLSGVKSVRRTKTVSHWFTCLLTVILLMVAVVPLSAEAEPHRGRGGGSGCKGCPLVTKNDLVYIGGFRVPGATYGDSRAAYSQGIIALGANRDSIFLVGHAWDQAIGEFSIPPLVNSTDIAAFNMATNIQPFSKVLNRAPSGNPQNLDRIGGMALAGGSLVVNAYEYYDAPADDTHTTLVLHAPYNLLSSPASGFDSYDARAHASGWLSKIPPEWQTSMLGSYIAGNSSGEPIISRLSVGPSAFAFYPEKSITSPHLPSTITTTKLLDYSLAHPVGYTSGTVEDYLRNVNLTNKLWTHISRATYGFIVPATRSYFVVGFSGGHESGVGYKITQDSGNLCGGYCAYQAADSYGYYWIFNLDDLAKVKSGAIQPYDVVPYEYGKFEVPANASASGHKHIMGGTYDSTNQILYLVVRDGDTLQGIEPKPLIVAYKVRKF